MPTIFSSEKSKQPLFCHARKGASRKDAFKTRVVLAVYTFSSCFTTVATVLERIRFLGEPNAIIISYELMIKFH